MFLVFKIPSAASIELDNKTFFTVGPAIGRELWGGHAGDEQDYAHGVREEDTEHEHAAERHPRNLGAGLWLAGEI